jgi:hypothetical protein
MYEARCQTCRESFNPSDAGDLIHIERHDGQPCGGVGRLLGIWSPTLGAKVTIPGDDRPGPRLARAGRLAQPGRPARAGRLARA